MKCPHCNYEHGWSGELMECVTGKEGDFFTLSNSVKFERRDGYLSDKRDFFACPSCLKTFISDY